nr:MAG TPA: hypothetical protein [Caudoviricetes sp.]
MEKTTLLKIIRAVRELEIRKSKNDSQFEFYQKKKRRIERKEKRMIENSTKEAVEYYKKNKETLDFCYGFMDKIENENKAINNQIKQYLTNYALITLVGKLNRSKTFTYKKLDRIFDQIKKETNKIHKFEYCHCSIYIEDNYSRYLILDFKNYNDKMYIMCDFKKYLENHLTKKTITKKFSIDDFKKFISWNIKTPEQKAQDNATAENKLSSLRSKIEKLISDYNQERKKLTINQEKYKYMRLDY